MQEFMGDNVCVGIKRIRKDMMIGKQEVKEENYSTQPKNTNITSSVNIAFFYICLHKENVKKVVQEKGVSTYPEYLLFWRPLTPGCSSYVGVAG